ncbi:MAG TPA: polymer-forming cytoskeletal protein [Chromatiales bacterium]|nr:polymer-forming cytoskeletal protein [Chromatiales bacterium]
MGFFGGNGASGDAGDGKTILARGCSLRGELISQGAVHVDGEFEGSILGASNVSIGVNGRVNGLIRSRSLIISGEFEGEIQCASLELMQQAKVRGDVRCEQMTVEKGGVLEGRCTRMNFEIEQVGQPSALPAPEPA